MISLLEATKDYANLFSGIRISTRPDYINREVLDLLASYKVRSIELGAQSMDNEVLSANDRGHSADDVESASKLIKASGFSLGLQMMTGLYKSDFGKDICTARRLISLQPDTVRIYPTVTMKNTRLAELYADNSYKPYTLEQSVELCSKLILMFESANIRIIRLGLHYSQSLIDNSLGDNYHPAFKELCENKIFLDKFIETAKSKHQRDNFTVFINKNSLSKFLGQKKTNIDYLTNLGYSFKIDFDNTLGKYDLYIN